MKKILALTLVSIMLISLFGCSGGADTQSQADNHPSSQQEENGRNKATESTFGLAADEERVVENLVFDEADVEFFYDVNTNELVPYEGQEASVLFVGQWWENGVMFPTNWKLYHSARCKSVSPAIRYTVQSDIGSAPSDK